MSLASVLQAISENIIPNNNNEITANVLRPILIEMLQQPNELIGLLSNLNTSDNSTLVGAINELKSDLGQLNNITIYQGVGNPNNNSLLTPNISDFYSELDLSNNPIDLWVYNGIQWVSISNDNPVSYSPQSPSSIEQQTARDNIDVYSRTEVDDAISLATTPKTKALFEHVLTAGDIANPIIDLTLPNTPDLTEWDFLYINSGAVSPVSYTIVGNHLLIDKALLAYPIQAGRRITFRYMY